MNPVFAFDPLTEHTGNVINSHSLSNLSLVLIYSYLFWTCKEKFTRFSTLNTLSVTLDANAFSLFSFFLLSIKGIMYQTFSC